MSDWPANQLPLHITTWSAYSAVFNFRQLANAPGGTITWVANQAVYIPMMLPWPYPVNRVFWINGSTNTTTNVDFGIYTPSGTRLYSTGSTAMGVVSVPQYVTPTVPFILPAGRYYFAWTCSNTTNRGYGTVPASNVLGAMAGLLGQASALPLPATATFASYTTSSPIQLCGITRTQTGGNPY